MIKIKNLKVKHLKEDFIILRNVNLQIQKGEILGIAGESGSGKSILAKTLLGLIKKPLIYQYDKLLINNTEIKSPEDFKNIRGKTISMIFQNPTASLNPVLTIGEQLIETIQLHQNCSKDIAKDIAISLLEQVEIDFPKERLKSYPLNLSGGMNQRVMIALALASNPKILIADEPTTALDITTQTKIINLIMKLKKEKNLTVIFISHDLGLLEKICDRILILYAGEEMELLSNIQITNNKIKHPYTVALRKSIPNIEEKPEYLYSIPGQIEKNSTLYDNKCIFYNRCSKRIEMCRQNKPEFKNNIRCFNPY
ncbi:ABC transporter ATP-binding protein [Deferribacter thermophilus]|uniref:ABC transporter ATP-binding protein n=1 Tax=Deferribacter thermophilus TaxID=53573 RepID=UPI003C15C101